MRKKNLNEKGLQSLVTSFMLVVLAVTIVLLLVYFGYQSAVQASQFSDELYRSRYYSTMRSQVDNCLKVFEFNDMNAIADFEECIPHNTKGYVIEVMPHYLCQEEKFEAGSMADCEQRLIFYTNIPQQKTIVCQARLTVCVEYIPPADIV